MQNQIRRETTRRHYMMLRLSGAEYAEFERVRAIAGFSGAELRDDASRFGKSIIESAVQPLQQRSRRKAGDAL